MRHQPHLYVPGPWIDDVIEIPAATVTHVSRVLRYPEGGPVSYTDGEGTIGGGTWTGAAVMRGDESVAPRPARSVTMVVAPPKSKERQRFIVEKLQELGVSRLRWWNAERTQARPPRYDRSASWAAAALEQSRGAWLMEIDSADDGHLAGAVAATASGRSVSEIEWPDAVTLVVGPEGGLTVSELAACERSVSLGPTVLRTETAAVVAAAFALR